MNGTTNNTDEIEILKANMERLREEAKTDPSKRDEAKAAWAALEAASPKQKVSTYASRAGRRQFAETFARYRR